MMPQSPTTLLLLCLIAATLLGAGIGAALWHLRSAARVRRALESARRSTETERKALEAVRERERESIALKRGEARGLVARAREQAELARSRHDTLAVHAREQAKRIDALEAEILAHEERYLKLQRDLASDRAGRMRGSDAAQAVSAMRSEDDLPVLNRRVRRGTASGNAGGTSAAEAGFPIGAELDIPSLAESELPKPSDDLALDLLDTKDLLSDDEPR